LGFSAAPEVPAAEKDDEYRPVIALHDRFHKKNECVRWFTIRRRGIVLKLFSQTTEA
jgi:hypothetical protein